MELHACLLFLTLPGIHRFYLSKPFKPKAFQGTINFVGKTGERGIGELSPKAAIHDSLGRSPRNSDDNRPSAEGAKQIVGQVFDRQPLL